MARKRTLDRRSIADNIAAAEKLEEEKRASAEASESDSDESESDDDSPKPKKSTKKSTKSASAKPRTRTVKVVRMRAVWGVFDNTSKRLEVFPYNRREDAEAYIIEKNSGEKKSTYYIQLVKEPIEE